MNTPEPATENASGRDGLWREILTAIACFLIGALISTVVVRKQGAESKVVAFSLPVGTKNLALRLIDPDVFFSESVPADVKRRMIKEAFARRIQGMTWTWDGELRPGPQPEEP